MACESVSLQTFKQITDLTDVPEGARRSVVRQEEAMGARLTVHRHGAFALTMLPRVHRAVHRTPGRDVP